MASATSSATASSSEFVELLAGDELLADAGDDRDREGRDAVELHMADAALDRDQEVGEAADVGQARGGLGAGGAQEHVVRDRTCAARRRSGRR